MDWTPKSGRYKWTYLLTSLLEMADSPQTVFVQSTNEVFKRTNKDTQTIDRKHITFYLLEIMFFFVYHRLRDIHVLNFSMYSIWIVDLENEVNDNLKISLQINFVDMPMFDKLDAFRPFGLSDIWLNKPTSLFDEHVLMGHVKLPKSCKRRGCINYIHCTAWLPLTSWRWI